jgi:hypothetical protein
MADRPGRQDGKVSAPKILKPEPILLDKFFGNRYFDMQTRPLQHFRKNFAFDYFYSRFRAMIGLIFYACGGAL